MSAHGAYAAIARISLADRIAWRGDVFFSVTMGAARVALARVVLRNSDDGLERVAVRCGFDSLALIYREVLGSLEELTGQSIGAIHIVGGGSRNKVLSQLAAQACQRPVITGPVEATALGNLLVQVRASGEISSLSEIREVARQSSHVTRYEPVNPTREGPRGHPRKVTIQSANYIA